MNRLASVVLALGLAAGPAAIALAAGPATAPAAVNTAGPAHRAPATAMARHQVNDAEGDRMTHALNLLEANGYGHFSNFQKSGKDFTATVKQGSQQFDVLINPDTGQITRQG